MDLTDRVRGEAERKRLEAQLAQTQRMESVGRLAGGIAHDINNLLTPILGYAGLALEAGPPAGPTRGWLEGIARAARRVQDLTGKLLAFGRRQPLAPTTIELGAQVRAFVGHPAPDHPRGRAHRARPRPDGRARAGGPGPARPGACSTSS